MSSGPCPDSYIRTALSEVRVPPMSNSLVICSFNFELNGALSPSFHCLFNLSYFTTLLLLTDQWVGLAKILS